LRKIPVERRNFPSRILRLNFPRHLAREIVRLSTGIFCKYPSQTWYICSVSKVILDHGIPIYIYIHLILHHQTYTYSFIFWWTANIHESRKRCGRWNVADTWCHDIWCRTARTYNIYIVFKLMSIHTILVYPDTVTLVQNKPLINQNPV
jgi:hypothetical protein